MMVNINGTFPLGEERRCLKKFNLYSEVCPRLLFKHFLMNFNDNIHTRERNTFEIDGRENIQGILIDTLLFFT